MRVVCDNGTWRLRSTPYKVLDKSTEEILITKTGRIFFEDSQNLTIEELNLGPLKFHKKAMIIRLIKKAFYYDENDVAQKRPRDTNKKGIATKVKKFFESKLVKIKSVNLKLRHWEQRESSQICI